MKKNIDTMSTKNWEVRERIVRNNVYSDVTSFVNELKSVYFDINRCESIDFESEKVSRYTCGSCDNKLVDTQGLYINLINGGIEFRYPELYDFLCEAYGKFLAKNNQVDNEEILPSLEDLIMHINVQFNDYEYFCPDCFKSKFNHSLGTIQAVIDECIDNDDEDYDELYELSSMFDIVDDIFYDIDNNRGETYIEVYSYYLVSCSFGEWLKDNDYAVLDSDCGPIWGRETYGQSIVLDNCIAQYGLDHDLFDAE